MKAKYEKWTPLDQVLPRANPCSKLEEPLSKFLTISKVTRNTYLKEVLEKLYGDKAKPY